MHGSEEEGPRAWQHAAVVRREVSRVSPVIRVNDLGTQKGQGARSRNLISQHYFFSGIYHAHSSAHLSCYGGQKSKCLAAALYDDW